MMPQAILCIYNDLHLHRTAHIKMKRPLVPLIHRLDLTSNALLSKAYSSQIISLLPEICEQNCAGCIESHMEHDLCDLSLVDKVILLRSDLIHAIDEEKVTSDIIYFANCLDLDIETLDPEIFDTEQRRDLLKSKSFWQQISCHLLISPILLKNRRYDLFRTESSPL